MTWEKVKLGELYTVHNGLSKSKEFFGKGFPFLSFSTVFNHWFLPNTLDNLVESSEKEQDSFSIKRGDIFITRTSETMNELGMSSVALKDYPKATYNGFTKRLRPIDNTVLPEFIGYYLRSPKFRGKFMAFSSMTTRASLANNDLLNMEINLPPLPIQNKIAAILSRYDDLIENYQRQIKLLEEASQRLYKEWFVDLHFPNYENTKIINGIPEGWKKGLLNDVSDEVGEHVNSDNLKHCQYYVPIDCLPKKSFTYIDSLDLDLAKSSLSKFKKYDILFGAMRPYFHKVCIARNDGVTRTTCFVIRPKNQDFLSYLYLLLFSDNVVKYATSISVGTTMPYTRWNDFKNMPIIIPDKLIVSSFQDRISPMIQNILLLTTQITHLTEARDRLLPKLMSGEIEV